MEDPIILLVQMPHPLDYVWELNSTGNRKQTSLLEGTNTEGHNWRGGERSLKEEGCMTKKLEEPFRLQQTQSTTAAINSE